MQVQLTTQVFNTDQLKPGSFIDLTFNTGTNRRGLVIKATPFVLEIAYFNEIGQVLALMDLFPSEATLLKEVNVF